MMKKLCAAGLIAAAAAGVTLLSAPAYADTNAGNSSSNNDASQSGNNFGNVLNANVNGQGSTGDNSVNSNSITGTTGSDVFVDDVHD